VLEFRDADTWPPVREAFDWAHGVITMGAALESETTAATLGKEGVRAFNPMAILDFLSVHIGKYLKNYLEFEKKGYIPKYEDLKKLFKEVLNKDYSREDYEKQFTIRVPEFLAKIERIEKIYRDVGNIPEELFKVLEEERHRLIEAKEKYGDYISPFQFE